MADFCRDCSFFMFGEDYRELALAPDDPKRGTLEKDHGWTVLCESCGPIIVDDEGKCLDHTEAEHEILNAGGTLPDATH